MRLSFGEKASYGLGSVSQGVKDIFLTQYLILYFSQLLGVPPQYAGQVAFVALLFDAVSDPVVGSLSDNWHSRRGRRHPFIFAAALPFGLVLYGLFSPPAGLSTGGLLVWMLVGTILLRMIYTFFSVPYLALGAELSADYNERTSVAAHRLFFAYLGGTSATALGLLVFFPTDERFPNAMLNPEPWPRFAAFAAATACVAIWLSGAGTRRRIPALPVPPPDAVRFSWRQLGRELRGAWAIQPFRVLFVAALVNAVLFGLSLVWSPYVVNFVFALEASEIAVLTVAAACGGLPGAALAPRLNRRWDKKRLLIAASLLAGLLYGGPLTLRLVGAFPANDSPYLVPTLFLVVALGHMLAAMGFSVTASMLADTADAGELHSGRRQEGVFFAALSFAQKVTFGLGTSLAGWGLLWVGLPPQLALVTAAPPEALQRLMILAGPLLGAAALLPVLILFRYRLTRVAHARVVAELAARRGRRLDRPTGGDG